jgi:hypothetical protein
LLVDQFEKFSGRLAIEITSDSQLHSLWPFHDAGACVRTRLGLGRNRDFHPLSVGVGRLLSALSQPTGEGGVWDFDLPGEIALGHVARVKLNEQPLDCNWISHTNVLPAVDRSEQMG